MEYQVVAVKHGAKCSCKRRKWKNLCPLAGGQEVASYDKYQHEPYELQCTMDAEGNNILARDLTR
jgi:hypothetical protein